MGQGIGCRDTQLTAKTVVKSGIPHHSITYDAIVWNAIGTEISISSECRAQLMHIYFHQDARIMLPQCYHSPKNQNYSQFTQGTQFTFQNFVKMGHPTARLPRELSSRGVCSCRLISESGPRHGCPESCPLVACVRAVSSRRVNRCTAAPRAVLSWRVFVPSHLGEWTAARLPRELSSRGVCSCRPISESGPRHGCPESCPLVACVRAVSSRRVDRSTAAPRAVLSWRVFVPSHLGEWTAARLSRELSSRGV